MNTPHRRLQFALSICALLAATAASASTIEIWRSRQVGSFYGQYFNVSVGEQKHPTPTGRYRVQKKDANYWSKKYDRAMPYAVFFTNSHAIHAGDLSTQSHGCIRVDYPTAEWLFHYARTGTTRVIVHP